MTAPDTRRRGGEAEFGLANVTKQRIAVGREVMAAIDTIPSDWPRDMQMELLGQDVLAIVGRLRDAPSQSGREGGGRG